VLAAPPLKWVISDLLQTYSTIIPGVLMPINTFFIKIEFVLNIRRVIRCKRKVSPFAGIILSRLYGYNLSLQPIRRKHPGNSDG
jgi:hypothetical protein